ncbi:MAG: Sugar-binding transcriptional regulator, LacI family [Haloplasmataceae bacterium]|jgi:LacI family transcriptional regulator|nr:Sugar-binding transcriptional regulator, LacI family [Haloplasmataceae bacterium]
MLKGDYMVTIKDVAREAGVSISTASYALNDDPRISKDTKERVLEVAKQLQYYPNAAARNLKRKRTNIVGVFVDGFAGPIYSSILDGIHLELINNGFSIVVSSGDSGKQLLLERQVDGAIIMDHHLEDDLIKHVAKNGMPIIILDRNLSGENIFVSMMNSEEIVYQLIVEMIKKGYKKIGYLSGPDNSYDNLHRLKGLVRALTEYNLSTDYYYKGEFTKLSGYNVAKNLIATEKNLPEFIFCANDEMAIGLMDAFIELGVRIPQDIAVAGFDNIEISSYITPKLTTVNVDRFNWGRDLASALIDLLINKCDSVHVDTKCNIIYRESC